MRVLVVDTYYPSFLGARYTAESDLSARSYADQLSALIESSFGTSDAYSRHLRRLGSEATEVVANCEPLQRRWLRERGARRSRGGRLLADRLTPGPRRRLLRRILTAQIEDYRPDVLYVQDPWFTDVRTLDDARRRGALVVAQIASPPPAPEHLRHFDLILTSFPHYVDRFRALGVASEYLRIGFDEAVPARLERLGVSTAPDAPRPHAASFVGGLDPRVHAAGTALLERACAQVELQVWGYGASALAPSSAILPRYRGEAWGLDMYSVLARSRIALNRHIDAAEGHANNMRLYEATGAGALLLTDQGSNLGDLFEPGREIVTYESADDLIEKLRHFDANEEERLRIASAGKARTFAEHTYADRIAELNSILADRLERRTRKAASQTSLA